MADIDLVQKALTGYVADLKDATATNIVNPKNAALQLVKRRKVVCRATDGGTAATAWTETVAFAPDIAVNIIAVNVAFPVAVTANATNLATILVAKRDAGGLNSANICTTSTNTSDPTLGSNAVAFKSYSMPVTTANASVVAGGVVTLAITKGGTGVALAAATSDVTITIVYEEVY